jgi:hypothetical protein
MIKVIKKITSTCKTFFSGQWMSEIFDIPAYRHDARWQRYRRLSVRYFRIMTGSILGMVILDMFVHLFESFFQNHSQISLSLSVFAIAYCFGLLLTTIFMMTWDASLRRKLNREIAQNQATQSNDSSHHHYQGRYAMMQQQKAQHGENTHPELQFSDMQGLDQIVSDYFGIKHQFPLNQIAQTSEIEKEKE